MSAVLSLLPPAPLRSPESPVDQPLQAGTDSECSGVLGGTGMPGIVSWLVGGSGWLVGGSSRVSCESLARSAGWRGAGGPLRWEPPPPRPERPELKDLCVPMVAMPARLPKEEGCVDGCVSVGRLPPKELPASLISIISSGGASLEHLRQW